MGSLILPAVEAMLRIYKTKLPKKTNSEISAQISLPVRDMFKQLIVTLETFKIAEPVQVQPMALEN